jgi:hypothetical protein
VEELEVACCDDERVATGPADGGLDDDKTSVEDEPNDCPVDDVNARVDKDDRVGDEAWLLDRKMLRPSRCRKLSFTVRAGSTLMFNEKFSCANLTDWVFKFERITISTIRRSILRQLWRLSLAFGWTSNAPQVTEYQICLPRFLHQSIRQTGSGSK